MDAKKMKSNNGLEVSVLSRQLCAVSWHFRAIIFKVFFWVMFWQHFLKLCLTVSVGKESRKGLVGWFWLRVSSENAIKLSVITAVIWQLDWRRARFWAHMWMLTLISPLLVIGHVVSPSLCRPPIDHLSVLMSISMADDIPQRVIQETKTKIAVIVFHYLISEVTYHHTCHILLVTQTNIMSEGTTPPSPREHMHQDARSILGGCFHSPFSAP